MDKILQSINRLKGVNYACIYKDEAILGSTFPAEKQPAIEASREVIEQIFSALQAIGKKHDELYFSVGNQYLASYWMENAYLAILLTEKKINLPMLHMGIRSANKKLQSLTTTNPSPKQANSSPKTVPRAPQSSSYPQRIERIKKLLTEFLGPAAPIVCDDAMLKWQETYLPNETNLPHLIEMIQQEITDENEQQNFLLKAKKILT
jgi:predicted regulator of Ras-like GTPase activity (Roadblock/LC7/MglB family)